MIENENKKFISKEDCIMLLNNMMNESNREIINQYINRIHSLNETMFQQILSENHVETIEDVEKILYTRIAENQKSKREAPERTEEEITDEKKLAVITNEKNFFYKINNFLPYLYSIFRNPVFSLLSAYLFFPYKCKFTKFLEFFYLY